MELHLEGYIDFDYKNSIVLRKTMELNSDSINLVEEIEDKFKDKIRVIETNNGTLDEKKELKLEDVAFRLFTSDDYISLDECIDKQILMSEGLLEVDWKMFGYSEFTLICLEITSMRLGGHDLESLFKCNRGKYAHILITA